MMAGAVLASLLMLVFFHVLETREPLFITLALVAAVGIIHPMMFGPETSFVPGQFPTRVRFSGAVIAKQLATVFGGGYSSGHRSLYRAGDSRFDRLVGGTGDEGPRPRGRRGLLSSAVQITER